jgi:hypothetical protein
LWRSCPTHVQADDRDATQLLTPPCVPRGCSTHATDLRGTGAYESLPSPATPARQLAHPRSSVEASASGAAPQAASTAPARTTTAGDLLFTPLRDVGVRRSPLALRSARFPCGWPATNRVVDVSSGRTHARSVDGDGPAALPGPAVTPPSPIGRSSGRIRLPCGKGSPDTIYSGRDPGGAIGFRRRQASF